MDFLFPLYVSVVLTIFWMFPTICGSFVTICNGKVIINCGNSPNIYKSFKERVSIYQY